MNFGIIFCFILLLFFIIGYFIKFKKNILFFYFFDFILSSVVYFIYLIPGVNYDMTRYIQLLDTMRFYNQNGLASGLNWAINSSPYSSQPLDALYFWIFSLFKENGYLFSVTTLIFLLLMSKFVVKVCIDLNISIRLGVVIKTITLMIFCLGWEISGLRNFLAFMLFAVTLYYETTTREGKIKYFLVYFLCSLIHQSCWIFLIFRLLYLLKNKIWRSFLYTFAFCYMLFISSIIVCLERLHIFGELTQKANIYIHGEENFQNFEGTSVFFIITCILISLIIEILIFNFTLREKNQLMQPYLSIYYLFVLFTLGSFLNTQIYIRSTMLLLFLSIPIKIVLFKYRYSWVTEIYKSGTFIFSVLVFIFWYDQVYVQMLI